MPLAVVVALTSLRVDGLLQFSAHRESSADAARAEYADISFGAAVFVARAAAARCTIAINSSKIFTTAGSAKIIIAAFADACARDLGKDFSWRRELFLDGTACWLMPGIPYALRDRKMRLPLVVLATGS